MKALTSILNYIETSLFLVLVQQYKLKEKQVIACDAIIPHGYGLGKDGTLLKATASVFNWALRYAKRFPRAPVIVVSTNYWQDEHDNEQQQKLATTSHILNPIICVPEGAKNTIDEVRNTAKLLPANLQHLLVICDPAQMRRARIIWKHFCPDKEIQIISVESRWDGQHRAWLMRSPLRWLLANFIAHSLLLIKGVKGATSYAQSFKKA